MPNQFRIMRFIRQRRRPARRRAARVMPVGSIESLETRTLLAGNPLDSIPQLNSLPDAPVSIYLDFDGHTEAAWGNFRNVVTPVYDIDDDATTFSDDELSRISQIWNLVAEDFRPFDVNVTTVDPGSYNNFESILISIGGNGSWYNPETGGVARVDGFSNSQSNSVFVFSDNQAFGADRGFASFVAFTVSHEAGHAFGLNHRSQFDEDGNRVDEYEPGTLRQGPLMGQAFFSERNTWTTGPSIAATVTQDALAVMTRAANQTFNYRVDDYGNDRQSATTLSFVDDAFAASGVIERNLDEDFFAIEPTAGTLDVSVNGLDLRPEFGGSVIGTNADLVLKLYDSRGNLIEESAPTDSLNASLSVIVEDRTYYVAVTNTGEYGALGQFDLSGTLTTYPTPVITSPLVTTDTRVPTFEWMPSSDSTIYELQVESVANGQLVINAANITATSFTPTLPLPQGDYLVRAKGQNTDWSDDIPLTVDVPTPDQPVVASPSFGQVVENPVVTFDWSDVDYAASYEVQLRNLRTNELTTLTTAVETSEFTVAEFLPDDPYRVWVRATNEALEQSEFSSPVDFTVDVPPAARPTVTAPIGTVRNQNQVITWNPVAGAVRYELWMNGVNQSKLVYEPNLSAASFEIPQALPEGLYRTWVKAYNQHGESDGWSLGASFTVDVAEPLRPVIVAPTTVSTTRQPTIAWNQSDNNAVAWELWVNDATNKTVKVIHLPRIEVQNHTAQEDLPDGEFHAWVRAINAVGEYGGWSSRFEFVVSASGQGATSGSSTPQLLAPTGDVAGSAEDVRFTWSNVTNAAKYQLFVRDLETGVFQRIDVNPQQTTDVTNHFVKLKPGTYRAWVRSVSPFGMVSPWSEPVSFSVLV